MKYYNLILDGMFVINSFIVIIIDLLLIISLFGSLFGIVDISNKQLITIGVILILYGIEGYLVGKRQKTGEKNK